MNCSERREVGVGWMEPFIVKIINFKNKSIAWIGQTSIGIASHLQVEAGVYMMNVANKSSEDGRELNVFTRSNI